MSFSATPRKQCWCRLYTTVTAIILRFESLSFSLPSSHSALPLFFSILFGNTAKTALVSALHCCHGDLTALVSVLHCRRGDFPWHDLSLSASPSPLISHSFTFSFCIFVGTTTKTALISALHHVTASISRFESLSFSLQSSQSPLPLFYFFILFGNNTETALVSALHCRHGDYTWHDLSLFPSTSPLISPPFPFLIF